LQTTPISIRPFPATSVQFQKTVRPPSQPNFLSSERALDGAGVNVRNTQIDGTLPNLALMKSILMLESDRCCCAPRTATPADGRVPENSPDRRPRHGKYLPAQSTRIPSNGLYVARNVSSSR
jgi:hypothetical protein